MVNIGDVTGVSGTVSSVATVDAVMVDELVRLNEQPGRGVMYPADGGRG